MADLARIKRNVARMVERRAPADDIDGYIASEGVTVDDVRNYRPETDGFGEIKPHNPGLLENVGNRLYDAANALGLPANRMRRDARSIDAAVRGAADTASLGFADEIAAGAGAVTGIGGEFGNYGGNLEMQRAIDEEDATVNPTSRLAGQVAGGVGLGSTLVRNGLSFAGNAVKAGHGLMRTAAGSAADGAILGALQGFGSGEGVEDRAYSSAVGSGIGGALGFGIPYAVAAGSGLVKTIASPIMARLRPDTYSNAALGEGMKRAGADPESIMKALEDARADDQAVYSVADALGLTGQRMASTVSRTPHDMRQTFIDNLDVRQGGQSRRIINALSEAFDAPDTAAQRSTLMTRLRDQTANSNYAAARNEAAPVNIASVIDEIDKVLTPGVHGVARPNNQIANDSIEGAYTKVRAMLTDGKSNLTDFNALFRAKLDLDDMIQQAESRGAGNRAHYLGTIQRKLDQALADASPPYAQARDTFAADSRAIEAIDTGRAAATRGRSQDTIPAFRGMNVDEQYGFRGGYADPLIDQVEGAAPGVNKARPLLNDATQAEFPEFAIPGKGEKLARRLSREDQMFQTRRASTGGSLTADNLADQADMAQFDPTIVGNLVSGRFGQAAMSAITRALNEGKGMPAPVLSRVAKALMETDPQAARQMLENAAREQLSSETKRSTAIAVLNALGASGSGRLALP